MTLRTRRSRLLVGLLTGPVVCVGLLATPASASSVPGGTVKGLVTIDGKPLAGAQVTLVRRDGDSGDSYSSYKTVTTNSAGKYSLTRPRGSSTTYLYDTVVVTDHRGRAATDYREFFGNKSTTVTRNVTLKPAATIVGKITRADGDSQSSITARIVDGPDPILIENLFDVARYDTNIRVGADGTYRFIGLPAGSYTICYHDTKSTYLNECFDETLQNGTSVPTEVSVKAGATRTLRSQVLDHLPAHVRGLVTDTSGKPISGINVRTFGVGASGSHRTDVSTNGRYDVPSGAGKVQVRFDNPAYETRWLNSASRAGAQVFSLVEGATVDNVSVALRSAASIKTTAKPGRGKATFTVAVTARATGARASGKVTVSRKGVTRTLTLKGGKASMTLKGIPAGIRTFTVAYGGSSGTAGSSTTIKVKIG